MTKFKNNYYRNTFNKNKIIYMYSFKQEDNIYDWISCLDNKLYFGPFPNQIMIDKLLYEKFDIIVNLTMDNESVFSMEDSSYKIPKSKYIHYPIIDNDIPQCILSYCSFITKLKRLYEDGMKIYIHCRGGHGRSGMTSTSLLIVLKPEKSIKEIIEDVNNSHTSRIILRDKWKEKTTPFNYHQYSFIMKVHKNIYINIQNKYYGWLIFNEKIDYNQQKFYNIYDFFINDKITQKEKEDFLRNYFNNKVLSNKDVEYKLRLTYLKRIVLTDSNNKDFCNLYSRYLYDIRESFFTIDYSSC